MGSQLRPLLSRSLAMTALPNPHESEKRTRSVSRKRAFAHGFLCERKIEEVAEWQNATRSRSLSSSSRADSSTEAATLV